MKNNVRRTVYYGIYIDIYRPETGSIDLVSSRPPYDLTADRYSVSKHRPTVRIAKYKNYM